MRTVQDIYTEYTIMPSLQLHQLRVAAVGKFVCENMQTPTNKDNILLACLFHDMGNIIKFDLSYFPEFLEPEGLKYWEEVKADYVRKYGNDQHAATEAIARELGLPDGALRCIEGIGFSKLRTTRDSEVHELKIAEYADLRVGPHGVLPMTTRIEEAGKRYVGKHPDMPRSTEEFSTLVAAARDLERQIFSVCSVAPEDIHDDAIRDMMQQLRDYSVA